MSDLKPDGMTVTQEYYLLVADDGGIVFGVETTGGRLRFVRGEGTDSELIARAGAAWNQRPKPAGEMEGKLGSLAYHIERLEKVECPVLHKGVPMKDSRDVLHHARQMKEALAAIASHLSAPDGEEVEKPVECLGKAMAPDEDYEDDFCDLYEASEIGEPCKGQCYYATHPQRTQGEPAQGEREKVLDILKQAMHGTGMGEYPSLLALREALAEEILSLLATPQSSEMEVVCLCGSTRFADQHAVRRWELEQEGQGRVIVQMINYLPAGWAEEQGWDGNDHFGEITGTKEMLDELHLRKIDLSDRVEVINPGGYVGESTANEINYAIKTGKPVTYMDDGIHGPGVAILQEREER